MISWAGNGEHHRAADDWRRLLCSRSYYFPFLERVLIPLTPFSSVGLPLPFHPSGVCVGGIKVVLLSSKLQISFASVHLTLRFITVARGATRFGSPLPQSNNSYQLLFHSSPLSATLLLPPLRSGVEVGRGGLFSWRSLSVFLRGVVSWRCRDVQSSASKVARDVSVQKSLAACPAAF